MSLSGRGGRCDRASGRVAKSNMDAKSGARSIATISAATALSSDHDMSATTVLAVAGCICTGGTVCVCVYRRYKAVVRRDDVLGLDLPLNHVALTTKTLRIPRSRHGRYHEQKWMRESIDGRIDSGFRMCLALQRRFPEWEHESCTQVEAQNNGISSVASPCNRGNSRGSSRPPQLCMSCTD